MSEQDTKNPISSAVGNLTTGSSSMVSNLLNSTGTDKGSVLSIIVIGLVVTIITAYILWYTINATVINQTEYILNESKMPIIGSRITKLDGDKIPNSGNGKRASISFWIYIHDLSKFSGSYRHVFHRGEEDDTFEAAGPYVLMDKDTNSISITWACNKDENTYPDGALSNNEQKWQYFKQAHGITFDYIPLQRWVHVCAVVNENAQGGSITGYIDGELVKSVVNDGIAVFKPVDTASGKKVTPRLMMQDANLDKKGNIYTGGTMAGPFGFSGLLCNIAFYNYDLSANDVYKVYKKGPIDNLLAKLGLPSYGVRSPVYRVG
jgi:hypothetical protein